MNISSFWLLNPNHLSLESWAPIVVEQGEMEVKVSSLSNLDISWRVGGREVKKDGHCLSSDTNWLTSSRWLESLWHQKSCSLGRMVKKRMSFGVRTLIKGLLSRFLYKSMHVEGKVIRDGFYSAKRLKFWKNFTMLDGSGQIS